MRKKIIIGNWKMNKTKEEAESHIEVLKIAIKAPKVDVVICPPFVALETAKRCTDGTNINLGAQNVYFEPRGAYTGEISAEMLECVGVSYCIIGHSDRRNRFFETDKDINKKAKALLERNIVPVICVGDSIEEKILGNSKDKIEIQLRKALEEMTINEAKECIIAYEPLWAISTNEGIIASPEEAEDMCEFVRYVIQEMFGVEVSDKMRVLYGGSVNLDNVKAFVCKPNIDGALVGGASLKQEFAEMINMVNDIK